MVLFFVVTFFQSFFLSSSTISYHCANPCVLQLIRVFLILKFDLSGHLWPLLRQTRPRQARPWSLWTSNQPKPVRRLREETSPSARPWSHQRPWLPSPTSPTIAQPRVLLISGQLSLVIIAWLVRWHLQPQISSILKHVFQIQVSSFHSLIKLKFLSYVCFLLCKYRLRSWSVFSIKLFSCDTVEAFFGRVLRNLFKQKLSIRHHNFFFRVSLSLI